MLSRGDGDDKTLATSTKPKTKAPAEWQNPLGGRSQISFSFKALLSIASCVQQHPSPVSTKVLKAVWRDYSSQAFSSKRARKRSLVLHWEVLLQVLSPGTVAGLLRAVACRYIGPVSGALRWWIRCKLSTPQNHSCLTLGPRSLGGVTATPYLVGCSAPPEP